MPCVLPVISLKIFGFINYAGKSRQHVFRSGLSFVAGIFVWFIGLALLLIALKSAGNQIGWAVQFTNPYFVLAMCVVVFVFALNLFGVFEFTLPQSAQRSVMEVSSGEGHGGAFFQGVFATVLGTSCTAPVLGAAVGFALAQSNAVILLMFLAIAAGMGFPFLLLSAQPAWVKWLPRPGAWMEHLKQLMGFPMLATLVFLLYVLGEQRGPIAVIWTLVFSARARSGRLDERRLPRPDRFHAQPRHRARAHARARARRRSLFRPRKIRADEIGNRPGRHRRTAGKTSRRPRSKPNWRKAARSSSTSPPPGA